jgi:hypothetical protein
MATITGMIQVMLNMSPLLGQPYGLVNAIRLTRQSIPARSKIPTETNFVIFVNIPHSWMATILEADAPRLG